MENNNFTSKSTLNNPDAIKVNRASNNLTERKQQTPVVSAEPTVKKKSKWSRIKEEFIVEDGQNIMDYLLFRIAIPAAKDALFSLVTNGVSMLLNRDAAPSKPNGYFSNTRTSYSKYYDQNYANSGYNYARPRLNSGYEYDEMLFETREDAEAVLWNMNEIANQYQYVKVADYIELSGRAIKSFTDNNYGWPVDQIKNVSVITNINPRGYYLDLPKPMEIN